VRRTASIVALTVLAVSAGLMLAAAARTDSASRRSVEHGCPKQGDAGGGTAQEAAAAAFRYFVHKNPVIHVQGRTVRRSALNTPVIEIAEVRPPEPLPGGRALARMALRRCPAPRTKRADIWAVVFHEGESVLCCQATTFFVGRRDSRRWFVF
jgi:hypothetical protein